VYEKLLLKLLEASEALDLNAADVQITNESNVSCHLLRVTAKRSHVFKSSPIYRGAGKSLARPGREQATATEDFDIYVSYL
jgi:hypothetical protein